MIALFFAELLKKKFGRGQKWPENSNFTLNL